MAQTLSTGITLYGVGEADKKKMGEEALLSVWGDSLENISSLRIIHNYMVAKDKLLGTDTLETINKTITGAINELNRKTSINIRTIKVNDNPVENLDGVVNLEIPTKTSEIENNSHIDIETNTDIVDTTDIGFGDTINIITEVNRDENGHVQNIKTVKSTLPVVTTNTEITGNGNALTSLDVNNGIINLKKEETFATKTELDEVKQSAVNWKQPIVTAVNSKAGTSLTINDTGDDIAYYINNNIIKCTSRRVTLSDGDIIKTSAISIIATSIYGIKNIDLSKEVLGKCYINLYEWENLQYEFSSVSGTKYFIIYNPNKYELSIKSYNFVNSEYNFLWIYGE